MAHMNRTPHVLAAAVVAAVIAGCAYSINPITGKRQAFAYTWAQEVQLGHQADGEIIKEYGVYDDPQLSTYVNQVGQKALQESQLRQPSTPAEFRDTPFTFRVLDSPVVNAFALPGGYVYVTRGLLANLDSEAQLGVVLGHEIGHVAARHASTQALHMEIAQVGLIGGAVIAEQIKRGAGEPVLAVGSLAGQFLFLKYSRDDERQADQLGVEYAAKAGYDAGQASAFFRSLARLSSKQGGNIPTFLSTHPDPGRREQTVARMAAEWKQQGYADTDVNQPQYYRQITGIVLGDDPRQGLVQNGIFYQPQMGFQFPVPANWSMTNSPQAVQLVDPSKRAGLVLQSGQAATPDLAAARFAGQSGVVVSEKTSSMVNGMPAVTVVANAPDGQGGVVRVMRTFIGFDGKVLDFIGITSTDAFPAFQATFAQTAGGFNRLRDQRIAAMKPVRLQVVTADRTAPFQSFLPSSLPSGFTAEEIAILNQVDLTQQIPRGALLKLPVAG